MEGTGREVNEMIVFLIEFMLSFIKYSSSVSGVYLVHI